MPLCTIKNCNFCTAPVIFKCVTATKSTNEDATNTTKITQVVCIFTMKMLQEKSGGHPHALLKFTCGAHPLLFYNSVGKDEFVFDIKRKEWNLLICINSTYFLFSFSFVWHYINWLNVNWLSQAKSTIRLSQNYHFRKLRLCLMRHIKIVWLMT